MPAAAMTIDRAIKIFDQQTDSKKITGTSKIAMT
jgi:hypothetical protein